MLIFPIDRINAVAVASVFQKRIPESRHKDRRQQTAIKITLYPFAKTRLLQILVYLSTFYAYTKEKQYTFR